MITCQQAAALSTLRECMSSPQDKLPQSLSSPSHGTTHEDSSISLLPPDKGTSSSSSHDHKMNPIVQDSIIPTFDAYFISPWSSFHSQMNLLLNETKMHMEKIKCIETHQAFITETTSSLHEHCESLITEEQQVQAQLETLKDQLPYFTDLQNLVAFFHCTMEMKEKLLIHDKYLEGGISSSEFYDNMNSMEMNVHVKAAMDRITECKMMLKTHVR